jgi:hypothetical protein
MEFSMRDLTRAKQFYADAFGWRFQDYGPGYAGIEGELREQGGFSLTDEGAEPAAPLPILYSENLESTLEAVRKAGAQIVQEIFSFPGGRRFHFKDPSGNELAVWSDHA